MANEMVNVRAVRVGLGLTQEAFCERFGLTLSVLRDWEQQRRHPSKAMCTLLRVIGQAPDLVEEALAA